jgi:hypothetical protein
LRAARCLGWIEGQLGKEPLAGSIARCNLPQLRNVCGTQWRVICVGYTDIMGKGEYKQRHIKVGISAEVCKGKSLS